MVPKFPLLKKYDQFWMKPKGSETNPRKWVLAAVTDILPSKIHVFVTTLSKPTADKTYKIEFILNRLPFQMERRALDIMQRFNLITFMFPEPVPEFSDHENRSHIQEYCLIGYFYLNSYCDILFADCSGSMTTLRTTLNNVKPS